MQRKITAVSTHSRPKAAGSLIRHVLLVYTVSTHSRPKAAGRVQSGTRKRREVSTHSRPKAAGESEIKNYKAMLFQHTAARRRLEPAYASIASSGSFQHTAARRRLVCKTALYIPPTGFNTQPPEGGWGITSRPCYNRYLFQHTAARRRLDNRPLHH